MLKDEVNTVFFQLREYPLFQHVKVGSSCHSGFSKEGPIRRREGEGEEPLASLDIGLIVMIQL
jgi:hypothetical protein